jgi:hypothetical protein
MTEQEKEQFIHLRSSIENLNKAWTVLLEIKKNKNNSLVWAAFQFALIEYSKPYKVSNGIAQKKHKLDESYIPSNYLDIHKRILESRDKILAHADLTVKDAKLHVAQMQSERFVGIVQNVIYGTEELSNIDEIIALIEQTLDNMYAEEKRLEALLPLTV